MPQSKLYIDKAKYDLLLRNYMCLKRENHDLKNAMTELKRRSKRIDGRVIDDIFQFETLEEEKAYLIGAFNSKKATEWDIEELEGKCYAANRN